MPLWAFRLFGFLGQRSLHLLVYAAIVLAGWGIYNKIFVNPTNSTTVKDGGKIVNVYQNSGAEERIPMFGCSAYKVKADFYWQRASKQKGNP